MEEGTCLGTNARTQEVFIGIGRGVVKCRTIKRLPEEERWIIELINFMKGTTWQPVPGSKSDHVPVEIREDGSATGRDEEDNLGNDKCLLSMARDCGVSLRRSLTDGELE